MNCWWPKAIHRCGLWTDSPNSCEFFTPPVGSTLLVLGDLGCLARDSDASDAWLRALRHWSSRDCDLSALVPCTLDRVPRAMREDGESFHLAKSCVTTVAGVGRTAAVGDACGTGNAVGAGVVARVEVAVALPGGSVVRSPTVAKRCSLEQSPRRGDDRPQAGDAVAGRV